MSCAFFLVVIYALLAEWPAYAEAAGSSEIFGTLRGLTLVLWFGYPIVWAVGIKGLRLLDSRALTSWGYSILDIGAKYIFAYLLLRWVASNGGTIQEAVSPGAATGGAPADD